MSIRNKLRIRARLRSLMRRVWPAKPEPLILMYHRIADEPADHWGLSVSPTHFQEHLCVVRRIRYALPLVEFVGRRTAGTLRPNAVALTFDDGYVDNLLAGKPRLDAADVPATVFLPTGFLDSPGEFWWDELARFILCESGPQNLELVIRGKRMSFAFAAESEERNHDAKVGASPATRPAALTAISRVLRSLEVDERQAIIAKLRSIFPTGGYPIARSRAMTRDEIRSLAADGLVTIGAHTVTHPVLPELDVDACSREIVQSKTDCEALTGAPVDGFAYPYGELDAKTRASVRAAGFRFACAAQHKPIAASSDVFALRRLHVRDCDGDAFEKALRWAFA
jgi:peptidoglycan/xylan/chitin deacetylase (PgdA/CDA1 family)